MNWEVIRKEYETTSITLKALAEEHDIKIGTLKSRKSREGWSRVATKKDATPRKKVATNKIRDATPNKNISWIELENEYVTDINRKPCTLEDLGIKYSIPIGTIEKYSMDNQWSVKRKQYKEILKQKHIEKTAERISNDLSKVTARHFTVSDKLLSIIEDALSDQDELYKYVEKLRQGYEPGVFQESIEVDVKPALNEKKLLDVTNALDKIQKMQRQSLDILDAKDKHKVEMDKRKLGGDDDEYEDDGFLEALDGKEVNWDEET
ncbi:hypothetical protein [Niallia sp. 03190]|uniref:hypothetical protein n=1 Tax=Niallia sp. 03190 TaxID=3458061 RepID=UPI0040446E8B